MTDDEVHLVPIDADLPGTGWMAVDEGFASAVGSGDEIGELFDCVGPDFPEADVVSSAASPHFIRAPRQLLHGFGVCFGSDASVGQALAIVTATPFVACLGRSVAADFQTGATAAELLAIDIAETELGHRVQFTGGDADGVRPVHLDLVGFAVGRRLAMVWAGNTPDPFPSDDLALVIERIRRRAGD